MTMLDTYVVRDTTADRAGPLLDELDTLISDLAAALAERDAVAALYDEAVRKYRVAHERVTLAKWALRAQFAGAEVTA